MDQKIAKIFSYFADIKNENIFSLCVLQLVEAYEDSPQALKPILGNLNTLFFSKTKEPRLKLKHRQLASGIIEKIISKHTAYLDSFLNRNNIQDMENFLIEEGQAEQLKSHSEKYQKAKWSDIPFSEIIEAMPLLLSSQIKFKQSEQELRKIQTEFFFKLSSTQTATATNVNILLGDLAFLQEVETPGSEDTGERLMKYEKKMEKLKKKKEEYEALHGQCITVFNPFNVIYEFGIENIMSPYWESRHLAVLLIKALLPSLRYIGFSFSIRIQNVPKQQSFTMIYQACKKYLEKFIKNNDSYAIKHEIIYQNILLLSLDRFADYQGERSNIMVRSVGANVLAYLYETLGAAQKHDVLFAIKQLLEHECSENDPLGLFAWQLRHSFVHLIYLIIEEPTNKQSIFNTFHLTFISLLDRIHEDQVILSICECLNLLSSQKFFTTGYARDINSRLWNIIQNLDDVSFSATKVFSLLRSYLNLIEIDELDCILKLRNFFTNRIEQVRKQFYELETEVFSRKFNLSTKQSYRVHDNVQPTKSNIIPWTCIQFLQEIMIQDHTQNLTSLIKLGASLFPYLLADHQQTMLVEFCSSVVCMFEPIQKIIDIQFVNKKNYQFICEEEKIEMLNDHINVRIWKLVEIVGEMLVVGENYLCEGFLEPFVSIGMSMDTRFLLISLGIASVGFRKRGEVVGGCGFLLETVEKALKLEEGQITSAVIDMYQTQFQTNFKPYLQSVTDPDQLQLCSKNLTSKAWDLRSKLHTFLMAKYTKQPSPTLHMLISLIETIVETQKQLMKHIKILASYCYCCLIPNEVPKPLNLIIKSIQECVREEKYHFISQIARSCMEKLSRILFTQNKSVYVKFNTNTLNNVANKYQLKRTNIERKRGQFQIDARRMEAIGDYIQDITKIDPNWLNIFQACFLKGFEEKESLSTSLNLVEGTIEHIVNICEEDFLKKLLGHLESQIQIPAHMERRFGIIKKAFVMLVCNWRPQSNTFLQWFYKLFGSNQIFIKILKESLEENIVKLSPVCCLFLLQSIRLMTGGGNLRQHAMACLSNLFMGAFISKVQVDFSSALQEIAQKGLNFVKDFKNISNFDYKIDIKQKLQLRAYQQEGVKWLGFLTKYYLNGALCDDMGLGKTLQTLTVIENQHYKDKKSNKTPISLIVAPSTLVEHWKYQYKKYFQSGCMKICCIYQKNDPELKSIGENSFNKNLIITSYNVIQKSINYFLNRKFKFVILDEGHLAKNPRTNKFKALSLLQSDHKFILSGTPVQNRLLELWGIFELLMPGYLGTEAEFKTKYNKLFNVNLMTFKQDDLLFSKQQKDVLEALHIKVMPFILRRLKKQVLQELPDKIIQDHLCHMTDIQKRLYNKFNTSRKNNKLDTGQELSEDNNALSTLNQMRKIVNHPNLVGQNHTYEASGKFLALKDLLDNLGFESPESLTNKVIIFSRFNATLDLIQELLLDAHYKNVRFSKLVGSVPQNKRFSIAQQFNDSYDIKILLTTTSIGGYGLNLTSANVVIMFDHDYNPSVDMQAIDRAHRLGQKNILNVYRLVMTNTLEEKIMGIQRFKTNLASAIVNLDNASIKNVEDSKLPDLLEKVSLIQEVEKKKVNKSLYASMIEEMEKDAIDIEDYEVEY